MAAGGGRGRQLSPATAAHPWPAWPGLQGSSGVHAAAVGGCQHCVSSPPEHPQGAASPDRVGGTSCPVLAKAVAEWGTRPAMETGWRSNEEAVKDGGLQVGGRHGGLQRWGGPTVRKGGRT